MLKETRVLSSGRRKLNDDGRSLARFAGNSHLTTLRLHQTPGNSQAQPRTTFVLSETPASGVSAIKALEDIRERFRRDAHASIVDLKNDS